MKTQRIVWSVGSLLLLAGLAAARAEDAITLTRSFKKGDVYRYKTTVTASVMGMEAVVTSNTKQTVKEIKDNGEIVLVEEDEGTKVSLGGQDVDQPPQPPVTTTRDKSGKLVKYEREGADGFFAAEIQHLLAALSEPLLAEKAVKSGDSWEVVIDNPAVKEKKVTVKGTFLGTEKVDEKELWKVKQITEADTDADGNKVTMETTYWLDPANGLVVKAENSTQNLPSIPVGPVSWTMKMELIKKEG